MGEGMGQGGWTEEADCKIMEHVNTFGDCKWSVLASRLPERVAKQCKRRHKKLQKKKEDSKRDASGQQTDETVSEIDMISACVAQANMTANDFETNDTATPKKKKGNWSVEEDQKILNHAKEAEEIGNDVDWLLVTSELSGRNVKQCERRYNNLTSKNKKKDIKKGGWTTEEDNENIDHVNNAGDCKWSVVASRLSGRSA